MNWTSENILALVRQASHGNVAFSNQTIRQFIEIGRIRKFQKYSTLHNANTRINTLFIPLTSPLCAVVDGDLKPREIFGLGQIIGLAYALTASPYPFNIYAPDEVETFTMPFAHLRSLIEHDSSIRWQIIEYIAEHMKNSELSKNKIISPDPAIRLAKIFVELANKYGVDDKNILQINFKISQDELGARIGASRQTVNKYIQSFVERGLISKQGHRYAILNLDEITNFSQSV